MIFALKRTRTIALTLSVILLCSFSSLPVFAAEPVAVKFLAQAPVIDGVLDAGLEWLPTQSFPHTEATAEYHAATEPSFRIAYGAGFLYLYLDLPGEAVAGRDRAYQNGDGVQLALTLPQPGDAPSDEFYALGFTLAPNSSSGWPKKFIWYRNRELRMTELRSAQIETHSANGHTGVEILLPWREVYPFHPWLSEAIGFNLCYVKAFGETDRAYYFALPDDRLESEDSPRLYRRLSFEAPALSAGVQAYAVLERNHLERGDRVVARVAVVAAAAQKVMLGASLWAGEGTAIHAQRETVEVPAGLSRQRIELDSSALPEGGYTVSFSAPVERPEPRLGVSLLPPFDEAALLRRLNASGASVSASSRNTLRFQLEEIAQQRRQLRAYDTAASTRLELAHFLHALEAAEAGHDLLADERGTVRRAYRSQVDGTLRPYSLRLPAKLERGRRYPLIIYLHGSGEDDREQLRPGRFPEEVIQLAPNGRGVSNDYTTDHAQDDLREALDDVLANYPVDPSRIVLTGFSMGGYGVYRTFYEMPRRFRAIAVFSGHPSRGREDFGPAQPSFLEAKYLAPFRGVPTFIFHGGRDRNCPIELTKQLVDLLKQSGAQVEFHYEAEKGHEAASEATQEAFHQWLERILR